MSKLLVTFRDTYDAQQIVFCGACFEQWVRQHLSRPQCFEAETADEDLGCQTCGK